MVFAGLPDFVHLRYFVFGVPTIPPKTKYAIWPFLRFGCFLGCLLVAAFGKMKNGVGGGNPKNSQKFCQNFHFFDLQFFIII